MSPSRYRLLLTLPCLGFLSGALLFCAPLARSDTALFAPLAIVICIASWIALAMVSILIKCPGCGKSHFERVIPWRSRSLFFPKVWGAPWPERHCSQCGLEVGAEPH